MAGKTPQFTIKTGADSSLYLSREITVSDEGVTPDSEELGKIKERDFTNGSDLNEYPVLIRRTGDSLKGTTESIESNELRKGRTKSAPRKGNSSWEGSIDFELSPETYDDVWEATLRGEWTEWQGDSKSKINFDNLDCKPDMIFTKCGDQKAHEIDNRDKNAQKRLVGTSQLCNKVKKDGNYASNEEAEKDPDYPLVVTNAKQIEVHELTCGTKDIRYSILKNMGGTKGDDLFQEFEHGAVNSVSLSVTPGQIVTGSFSLMGANNPDLVQNGKRTFDVKKCEEGAVYSEDKTYFKLIKDVYTEDVSITNQDKLDAAITTGIYEGREIAPTGLLGKLATYEGHDSRFQTPKVPVEVQEWIDNLPQKGTSTDQYTAREGFLYINGERVRYGSTLSVELNNGLNKTFAIFEKDAIALSPMSLDITGTLGVYLIKDYSEKLYNLATQDKDAEIIFTFQDRENDPEALYVVQIPKTKFTDADIPSSAENLEVSFPFQSFEEKALRILRLRKRKPYIYAFDPLAEIEDKDGNPEQHAVVGFVRLSTNPNKYVNPDSDTGEMFNINEEDFTVKITNNGKEIQPSYLQYNSDKAELFIGFQKNDENIVKPTTEEQKVTLTVTYNDITVTKTVIVPAMEDDGSSTVNDTYSFLEAFDPTAHIYIKNGDGTFSEVTNIVTPETTFLPILDDDGNPNDWRNVFYTKDGEDKDVVRPTEPPVPPTPPADTYTLVSDDAVFDADAVYYKIDVDSGEYVIDASVTEENFDELKATLYLKD